MAFAELSPLGQVVVCGLFLLMVYGWMQTGGRLVRWLAANFPNPNIGAFGYGLKPFQPIVNALNGFDNYVQRVFAFYLEGTQAGWNAWCHQVASFVANVTESVDFVAGETQKALAVLRRSTIPALILGTLAPGSQLVQWLASHVASIVRASVQTATVAPKIITNTITKVEHLTTTVTKTLYEALPAAVASAGAITLPRIRGLERDVSGLEKWVKRHADTIGVGALVGGVAFALSKLGLSSSRCSNVQRYNKNLCGMESGLLNSLLADSTMILGTISLVEFAKGMETIVGEVAPQVRRFWRVG